jgi:hypothetical protein
MTNELSAPNIPPLRRTKIRVNLKEIEAHEDYYSIAYDPLLFFLKKKVFVLFPYSRINLKS